MKKLTDLVVQMTEEEYRKHPFISYSVLSNYLQKGFRSLFGDTKVINAGMYTGKIFDILLTGDANIVKEKIGILDTELPSDKIKTIIEYIIEYYRVNKIPYPIISSKEAHLVSMIQMKASLMDYGQSWKADTLITKVITEGENYYNFLKENYGKLIVSQDEFNDICDIIVELYENDYTKAYTNLTLVSKDYEFYDQLPLFYDDGVYQIKGLLDRVIVDHINKTIRVIDFKITNLNVENFEDTYLTFNYDLQASIYNFLIKNLIKNDDYYYDFVVLPFTFVVMDPNEATPIVWYVPEFEENTVLINKYGKIRKAWQTLYFEVMRYKELSEPPRYSFNIIENNGYMEIKSLKPLLNSNNHE